MSDQTVKHQKIILKRPLCIGIGGVSRSGKTFLAALINAAMDDTMIIGQDKYICAESEIPKINGHIDWEIPESIDWVKLKSDIEMAVHSGKTVLVEGLLAFSNPDINRIYDIAIFIQLGKREFLKRKQHDLRWGKEPDWYIGHIWNSYEKYGQLPEGFKHALLLDGEQDFDLNIITKYLESFRSG